MYQIRQSSTLTIPFFAHDANGDAATGLTDGSFTKRIDKAGAGFGAMTVTITEMENGWYSIPLSTAHSDTLGLLSITFTNAGAKQVNLQYRVEANLQDDLATDIGTAQTDLDTITGADGVNVATDAISSAQLATAGITEIVDGIWDEAQSNHVAAGSMGAIATETAAILSDSNAILVDTGTTLPATLATAQADLDTLTGADGANVATNAISSAQLAAAGVTEIVDAVWDEAQSNHVGVGSMGEIATETAAILVDTGTTIPGTITTAQADLDTITGADGVNLLSATQASIDAIEVDTAEIGAAGAGLTGITGAALSAAGVDAILDEAIGDSTVTMREALKLMVATLGGKLSGAATTTVLIRNVADDTNVVSATVDADGNRSAVTLTL